MNVDPDDELITNVAVTAANTADRQVIDELLDEPGADTDTDRTDEPADLTPTRYRRGRWLRTERL